MRLSLVCPPGTNGGSTTHTDKYTVSPHILAFWQPQIHLIHWFPPTPQFLKMPLFIFLLFSVQLYNGRKSFAICGPALFLLLDVSAHSAHQSSVNIIRSTQRIKNTWPQALLNESWMLLLKCSLHSIYLHQYSFFKQYNIIECLVKSIHFATGTD